MSDLETVRKCGCPVRRNILGQPNDFDPCPICSAVERLNQLAERLAECNEESGLYFELAYIRAADIVMEEFDE